MPGAGAFQVCGCKLTAEGLAAQRPPEQASPELFWAGAPASSSRAWGGSPYPRALQPCSASASPSSLGVLAGFYTSVPITCLPSFALGVVHKQDFPLCQA